MLFNSYTFVFVFLPVTLIGFFVLAHQGYKVAALTWLVIASLIFYGWSTPAYILLLAASILFNYGLGLVLGRGPNKFLLTLGVVANLGCLGYYKYAGFIVGNVGDLVGTEFFFNAVALPLAISFFTFQQISYLVDAHRGLTKEYSFLHYALFVTFFPQLVIGPIVHHSETIPQFQKDSTFRFLPENLAVGIPIFLIGLFKKVVVADTIAQMVDPGFALVSGGREIGFVDAWIATIGFCFQLYFDFSSYSDMAIGIARMFGIKLPANFDSPFRQTSISGLWSHWHITLYRFFRHYILLPLVFNRRSSRWFILVAGRRGGHARIAMSVMIVMVLSGIWHGSGWNFFLLGLINGFWILVELGWRSYGAPRFPRLCGSMAWTETSRILAFLAFASSVPLFRAVDFHSALLIFEGMLGLNGFVAEKVGYGLPFFNFVRKLLGYDGDRWIVIAIVFGLVFVWLRCLPNTQQFMHHFSPVLGKVTDAQRGLPSMLVWRPSVAWGLAFGVLSLIILMLLSEAQEFIYFRF